MKGRGRVLIVAGSVWLAALLVALATRPLLPIDETRYVSVAWEMWQRGDFLVPHLNGVPYSDKPPLLFWLMHAGWWVFGVSETWTRIAPSLVALVNLLLTARVARLLWPGRDDIARLAPLIVLGSLMWTVFSTLVMFDMLLTCFALVGILGVLHAWRYRDVRGWGLFAVAIGLGVLSKGPVILLHIVPVVLLAPWWAAAERPQPWERWYGGAALAVLLGAAIALAWAVPAAMEGGARYAHEIFLGQTAGRVRRSFAHLRPVWWYLPLLPAILFPWLAWPPVWRSLASLVRRPTDPGVRFCLAWVLPVLGGFSAVSGKQMHYLLPLIPGFAVLAGRALADATIPLRRRDAVIPSIILSIVAAAFILLPALAPSDALPDWAQQVPPWAGVVLAVAAVTLVTLPISGVGRWVETLACASAFLVVVAHFGVMPHAARAYDVRATAMYLRALEHRGCAIAHVGKYHQQYHFVGRLTRSFDSIAEATVEEWLAGHPCGAVISYVKKIRPDTGVRAHGHAHRYRGGYVLITLAAPDSSYRVRGTTRRWLASSG